jgi:hypothetical protein
MLIALSVDPQSIPHFTLINGILRYKNRVWIGDNGTVQHQLLESVHASTVGGHLGFLVTYRKIKQLFAWRSMKTDTHLFVQSCSICQQSKPSISHYPGLLSPLPIPDGPRRSSLKTSLKVYLFLVMCDIPPLSRDGQS